jgi:hypothetical protein
MKTIQQVFAIRRDTCIRKKPSNKKKVISPEKQDSCRSVKDSVISREALVSKYHKKNATAGLGTSNSNNHKKKSSQVSSSSGFKSPGVKRQVGSSPCPVVVKDDKLSKVSCAIQPRASDIVIDACTVLLTSKGDAVLSTQTIQKELGRFGDIEQIVLSQDERQALVKYSIDDAAVNCLGVVNLPEEAVACVFTVRMAKPQDASLFCAVEEHCADEPLESSHIEDSFVDSCHRPLIVYDEF